VRPKPFWWFSTCTLLLVAVSIFLFNRVISPPQESRFTNPIVFLIVAAIVFGVEYRGFLKSRNDEGLKRA